ncbi:MAG TPA: ABC transporter permease [Methylomirabilota bacterium]|jgi:peptide/nickel transport system permease protein|nr:ABC transporter permease [Methylomirabilota bacterium]
MAERVVRQPRAMRRRALALLLGAAAALVFGGVVGWPDRLAPTDPGDQTIAARLRPPGATVGSMRYVLGSDHLGRDVLSRIVFGGRISLVMGLAAVAVSVGLGATAGLLAGYFGGWSERAIMRLVDVQMAFPFILLAIVVVGVLGPSPAKVVLVIGVGGWVHFARVVRSEVLSLRERAFIEGARATGAGDGRIVVRHVLPNVLPTVIVLATTALAYAIVAESSLSFLGVGIPASVPSWGGMLADGRQYVDTAWWLATFPGLCILATALTVSVLGDLIRDARDASARPARVGAA